MKKRGYFRRYRQQGEGILFILPYGILWLVFLLGPMLFGFYMSLHKWDPLVGSEFLGLRNYVALFADKRFWNAFWVTWKFSLHVIPGIILFSLAFALMLQKARFRGAKIVESALFFPYLLNVSIISIIWGLMHDPDVGILHHLFRLVGLDLPPLLSDKFWVIPMIALTTVWWLMGYRMVVFRAALASIPQDLYDAAAIDGAGSVRTFFSITLPLLKPTLLFTLVITTVGGMRTFGQVILMTAGGPGVSSEVLALHMYRLGFDFIQFGKAAAVGFIIFAIIFGLSFIFLKALRLEGELR
jgi:ABC-type sugar transport system permease subunit